jgi:hypothetical protein
MTAVLWLLAFELQMSWPAAAAKSSRLKSKVVANANDR